MIATRSRALALAMLLAILATVTIAYHASTTNYASPPHATCVRVERAHVGAMAVEIEGAC